MAQEAMLGGTMDDNDVINESKSLARTVMDADTLQRRDEKKRSARAKRMLRVFQRREEKQSWKTG
jgi:hypothetical protein